MPEVWDHIEIGQGLADLVKTCFTGYKQVLVLSERVESFPLEIHLNSFALNDNDRVSIEANIRIKLREICPSVEMSSLDIATDSVLIEPSLHPFHIKIHWNQDG